MMMVKWNGPNIMKTEPLLPAQLREAVENISNTLDMERLLNKDSINWNRMLDIDKPMNDIVQCSGYPVRLIILKRRLKWFTMIIAAIVVLLVIIVIAICAAGVCSS